MLESIAVERLLSVVEVVLILISMIHHRDIVKAFLELWTHEENPLWENAVSRLRAALLLTAAENGESQNRDGDVPAAVPRTPRRKMTSPNITPCLVEHDTGSLQPTRVPYPIERSSLMNCWPFRQPPGADMPRS